MKHLRTIFILILCVAMMLGTVSCADLGEGEDENSFHKYFSGVYVLSHFGFKKVKISRFHDYPEGEEDIKEAVETMDYCYIAFQVAKDYTLTVNDFACFAKTNKGEGTLILEFFISDQIPTRLKDSDNDQYTYLPKSDEVGEDDEVISDETYAPETDSEGNQVDRGEVDEDIFNRPGYAKTTFEVSEEWDSFYLSFDQAQTVGAGHFIVIRVKNNCYIKDKENDPELANAKSVNFTFNHLMFNFSNVQKT